MGEFVARVIETGGVKAWRKKKKISKKNLAAADM